MENRAIVDSTRPQFLSVVMPSLLEDIEVFLRNAALFFSNIPIKNVYVVAPANVQERIAGFGDSRIIFIDENELCDVKRIRELYSSRTNIKPGRAGWYIQQFIKLAFSHFTKDDYYFIWDSDNVPIRPVNTFNHEGKVCFDTKVGNHPPYRDTISRILPGVSIPEGMKSANKTFISEHMLVCSEHMREMIREIEASDSLEGDNFQERILNAVALKDLPFSGFSEYETYGCYVMTHHEEDYVLRDCHDLSRAGIFYRDILRIDEQNALWLSSKYDSLKLEEWHKTCMFAKFVRSKMFQKLFPPSVLEFLAAFCLLTRKISSALHRKV